MSAQWQEIPPEPAGPRCPQCSTPVAVSEARCPACGYTLAGVDGRPGPYGRLWGVWAGALLALAYLVALAVVLLGR